MSFEKGQRSEINPTLRQNIPTYVVKFHATAECNRRTCAVSHFGENLLPAAVLAPAVAICLKSLVLKAPRQELLRCCRLTLSKRNLKPIFSGKKLLLIHNQAHLRIFLIVTFNVFPLLS